MNCFFARVAGCGTAQLQKATRQNIKAGEESPALMWFLFFMGAAFVHCYAP